MSSNSRRGHRDRQSRRGTNNSSSESIAPPAGPRREQIFSVSQQPRPPARLDEVVNTVTYRPAPRGFTQGSNAGGSNPYLPRPGTSSRPATRPPSLARSQPGPSAPNVSRTSFHSFPTPSTPSINTTWSAGIRPPTRGGTPQRIQEALRAFDGQTEQEDDPDGLDEYTPLQRYNVQGADTRRHVSLADYNRSASDSGTSFVYSESDSGPPPYSRPPSYAGSRDHVPQQMPNLPREDPPQYFVPQARVEEVEEPMEGSQQHQPRTIWSCCGGQSSSSKRPLGRKKKSAARRCGTINIPAEHGSDCRECGHRRCQGCEWGNMSVESGDPPGGGRPRDSEDDRGGPGDRGGSSRAKGKGKAPFKGGFLGRFSPGKKGTRT
ncbi:hypothetical protein Tdes44962_MAKER09154 [Teratosphaeria destructans]|uniref:Uncharacterized protein n=1 Tax=Teratosphaeria destructans TaxID=418781 RepID=A0A9W7W3G8_9PEZI|nr:hypothetical protein Tdes44962_MAKER09154 [Teratosphaeria destructans]